MTEPFHDSVRERLYWGACLPRLNYEALFGRFKSTRDEILGLVRDQTGLTERSRGSAENYLEEFFSIIDDPRQAERAIINACRKW